MCGGDCQKILRSPNHPPNVIKQLPVSIEKRLSNHSSDEKIFKESAICYEDRLNKEGCTNKLVYYSPSASSQENKSNRMMYGLTHHTLKISQQEYASHSYT